MVGGGATYGTLYASSPSTRCRIHCLSFLEMVIKQWQTLFYYSTMNAGKSNSDCYSLPITIVNAIWTPWFIDGSDWWSFWRRQSHVTYWYSWRGEFIYVNQWPFCWSESTFANKKNSLCFADEAQFLTKQQVYQLSDVVDKLKIPVLCYGLRTDFQAELFEGRVLLAWADQLEELKQSVIVGVKPISVLRLKWTRWSH